MDSKHMHPDDLLRPDLLSKTLVLVAMVVTALALALILWLAWSSHFVA